jgi:hypothetical protein
MKAMLDPKMVAAKIHGSDARPHGETVAPDLMTPSSQGCGKIFAIIPDFAVPADDEEQTLRSEVSGSLPYKSLLVPIVPKVTMVPTPFILPRDTGEERGGGFQNMRLHGKLHLG